MAKECKIEYRGKLYLETDFMDLLSDPEFAEELQKSLMTDMYNDILRDNPTLTQSRLIKMVKDKSGSTLSPREIKSIVDIESARRSVLKIGPSYQNELEVTSTTSIKEIFKRLVNRYITTGAIGGFAPKVKEAFRGKEMQMESAKNKATKNIQALNTILDMFRDQISATDKMAITNLIKGGRTASTLTLSGITNAAKRESIKKRIMEIASAMNSHMTDLSLAIMQSGVLSNVQMEIFQDNLGKYSLRAYKAYLNPASWLEEMKTQGTDASMALSVAMRELRTNNIPKRIKALENRIKNAIEKQTELLDAGKTRTAQELDAIDKITKSIRKMEGELDVLNNALVDDLQLFKLIEKSIGIKENKKSDFIFKQSSQLGINMDSFKKKNLELPQWYRDLLGEVQDPLELYEITVKRMSETAAAYSYQRAFAALGEGLIYSKVQKGIFSDRLNIENYPGLVDAIGVEEIYLAPGVEEELISELTVNSQAAIWFNTITSLSNWNMTVGSVVTQERNFFQAPFFMINNGNISPFRPIDATKTLVMDIWMEAVKNGANLVANKAKRIRGDFSNYDARTDFMLHLRDISVDYGVTSSSVDFENIKNLADNSKLKKLHDYLVNHHTSGIRPTYKTIKATIEFLNSVYSESDNIIKVANLKVELDRYSKLEQNVDYKELIEKFRRGEITEEQYTRVVKKAAKLTRDTVPNYGEVYKIIKSARKLPLIGQFASFYGEQLRTTINTVRYAKQEVDMFKETGNKGYLFAAAQRITGVSLNAAGHLMFADLMTEILSAFTDDDDEPVETKASLTLHKWYLPSYVASAAFSKMPDGTFKMLNSESVNPYGGLYSSFLPFLRDTKKQSESNISVVMNQIGNAIAPVIGLSVASETMMQFISGKDALGRDISDEVYEIDPVGHIADRVGFLLKTLAIPTSGKDILKVAEWSSKIVKLQEINKLIHNSTKASDIDTYEKNKRLIAYYDGKIESTGAAYLHMGFKTDKIDVHSAAYYKAKTYKENITKLTSQINKDIANNDLIKENKDSYRLVIMDMKDMYRETKANLGIDIEKDIKSAGFNKEQVEYITGESKKFPNLSSELLKKKAESR